MPLDAPPELASEAARRDEDIVELLAAGAAEAAFERLATRYAAKVHRLCMAMLREPAK